MSDDEDDVTLEGTLALIKPDAIAKEEAIMDRIRDEGFLVVEKKRMRFPRRVAERFYEEHRHKDFFPSLINYITSGDVIALCLARKDGIRHWRHTIGPSNVRVAMAEAPNSLRARYGNPDDPTIKNGLHGSDSPDSSEREIEVVFPHILHGGEEEGMDPAAARQQSREDVGSLLEIQPTDNREYLQKYVCPTLLRGLSQMYETRPDSPIKWLSEWLRENNPNDRRRDGAGLV